MWIFITQCLWTSSLIIDLNPRLGLRDKFSILYLIPRERFSLARVFMGFYDKTTVLCRSLKCLVVCILFKYFEILMFAGEFIYSPLPSVLMVDKDAKETKAGSQVSFMLCYVPENISSLVKFIGAGVYFLPFAFFF